MILTGLADEEQVWQNLIRYIDSQELFFATNVRNRLNPAARELFNSFLSMMLRHKILIPFRKKSFAHRIAYIIFWFKARLFRKEKHLLEIYVKGPGWKGPDEQSLKDLLSSEK